MISVVERLGVNVRTIRGPSAALGVRGAGALGAALSLLATLAAPWDAPDAVLWLAAVSGIALVVAPDSLAPLTFVGAIGGSWALRAPGDIDPWLLAALVGLLAVHVACALAASMPSAAAIDRRVFASWGRTAAALLLVTLAAAGVLALLERADVAGALALTLAPLVGITVLVWWSSGAESRKP